MIAANELRIGNYVYDANNELTQVNSIVDGAINYELDYGDCYFENINPIPITEEWLLKLGFEKHNYIFRKDGFQFTFDKKIIPIKFYGGAIKNTNIKYIHQLQNLYFALTQKELEYVG